MVRTYRCRGGSPEAFARRARKPRLCLFLSHRMYAHTHTHTHETTRDERPRRREREKRWRRRQQWRRWRLWLLVVCSAPQRISLQRDLNRVTRRSFVHRIPFFTVCRRSVIVCVCVCMRACVNVCDGLCVCTRLKKCWRLVNTFWRTTVRWAVNFFTSCHVPYCCCCV